MRRKLRTGNRIFVAATEFEGGGSNFDSWNLAMAHAVLMVERGQVDEARQKLIA